MIRSSPNPAAQPAAARPRLDPEGVRAMALEAGFADAGLVPLPHLAADRDATRFANWMDAGHAGTMRYLERKGEDGQLVRSRVSIPFPWARSAIVCFANYHCAEPRSTDPGAEGAGWIARYAWSSRKDANGVTRPSDYHK